MNVYDAIVVGVIAITWLASVKMICGAIVACAGVKGLNAEMLEKMIKEAGRL